MCNQKYTKAAHASISIISHNNCFIDWRKQEGRSVLFNKICKDSICSKPVLLGTHCQVLFGFCQQAFNHFNLNESSEKSMAFNTPTSQGYEIQFFFM